MAKALAAIEERKLKNIRLHHGDATDLLAWLPPASSLGSTSFIPIPGRRPATANAASCRTKSVAAIARTSLRPGGEFRFASDIPDYVAWTLLRLDALAGFCLDRGSGPTTGASRGRDLPSTRYEAKAKRGGRVPAYLIFRKKVTLGYKYLNQKRVLINARHPRSIIQTC